MIINAGGRTDIPAFYSEWFYRRIEEGFVLVRNPYYPQQVTRYSLAPNASDILSFCTKNPAPMLPRLHELRKYRQFWYVTITPYGPEIEPGVPPFEEVISSFRALSEEVGERAVGWRYDPIFLSETYSVDFHLNAFAQMARLLQGATHRVVISFIDLYEKTKKNFPEASSVSTGDQLLLGKEMIAIAKGYGMTIYPCLEGEQLKPYGAITSGCMTRSVLEDAIGETLRIPAAVHGPREGCECILGNDIGAYNTCSHFCRYCYANYDKETVLKNRALHDPTSPFLIGHEKPDDVISTARQEPYCTGQLRLVDFL